MNFRKQRDRLQAERENLAYEGGRYKEHYEDMLAQRDRLHSAQRIFGTQERRFF